MSLYASQADAKRKIQALLDANDRAVVRAVAVLYERQTASEQAIGGTTDANGVGFSGVDGDLLSSFAMYIRRTGTLSEKQMVFARKKVRKYWKQLAEIAESKSTPVLAAAVVTYATESGRHPLELKQEMINEARAMGYDP